MGEEIEFENAPKWSNCRLSWAPDLDLGSGHGHYLFHLSSSTTCISNFIEIEGTFCGRTDTRTDGNLTPILLGRLPKFASRPKKKQLHLRRILICSIDDSTKLNFRNKFWHFAQEQQDDGVNALTHNLSPQCNMWQIWSYCVLKRRYLVLCRGRYIGHVNGQTFGLKENVPVMPKMFSSVMDEKEDQRGNGLPRLAWYKTVNTDVEAVVCRKRRTSTKGWGIRGIWTDCLCSGTPIWYNLGETNHFTILSTAK